MTNIYDNFSETFSKSRKNMNWPEIEYMIDFIKNSESIKTIKKISILDVGCGNGRLLKFLNNSGLNFDYTGIDSSSGMINEAKKEFPNNKFIVLDMIKLDKLKEKFDIVFFIASFHHIFSEQDREKILKISKQDLNKQGYIFMTNWNLLGKKNFEKYQKSYKGKGDFDIKIGKYYRYYHGFSLEELEKIFYKIGFVILKNCIFEKERNILSILKNT